MYILSISLECIRKWTRKVLPVQNQNKNIYMEDVPPLLSTSNFKVYGSIPKTKFNFKLIILFKQLQKTSILIFSLLPLPHPEKDERDSHKDQEYKEYDEDCRSSATTGSSVSLGLCAIFGIRRVIRKAWKNPIKKNLSNCKRYRFSALLAQHLL